ncbi:MAG: acyltransferase domain-containing protein [Planctomycetota bacterium]
MSRWVAMFPGVSGVRATAPEVAAALAAAGPLSENGRLQVETYGASVAGYRALGAEPAAIAEHSMGIYAAMTCCGSWSFEDGARVCGEAARLIDASPPGSVAVSVGISRFKVEELAGAAGAFVANDNSELQQAVGGLPDAVDRFEAAARAAGAYDVVRVPLRGAVHTPMLENAARKLFEFLFDIEIKPPVIPFLNHVDVEWWTCQEMLRQHVAGALERRVRWRESAERLINEGYDAFVDVGPGDVLAKLMKWIKRDARIGSVAADFEGATRLIGS